MRPYFARNVASKSNDASPACMSSTASLRAFTIDQRHSNKNCDKYSPALAVGRSPLDRGRRPRRLLLIIEVIDFSTEKRVRRDPRGPGGPAYNFLTKPIMS